MAIRPYLTSMVLDIPCLNETIPLVKGGRRDLDLNAQQRSERLWLHIDPSKEVDKDIFGCYNYK